MIDFKVVGNIEFFSCRYCDFLSGYREENIYQNDLFFKYVGCIGWFTSRKKLDYKLKGHSVEIKK